MRAHAHAPTLSVCPSVMEHKTRAWCGWAEPGRPKRIHCKWELGPGLGSNTETCLKMTVIFLGYFITSQKFTATPTLTLTGGKNFSAPRGKEQGSCFFVFSPGRLSGPLISQSLSTLQGREVVLHSPSQRRGLRAGAHPSSQNHSHSRLCPFDNAVILRHMFAPPPSPAFAWSLPSAHPATDLELLYFLVLGLGSPTRHLGHL